ncbi:barstar family protein [Jatrophihabitans cynanchi]|uniref:Barstar family protein n=1 Tax=Jatrophihabitans cynanchi TaxID=2944128 RepID=A0ABY7JZC5_9ACTN|nr:barstar family protein [Jatrophihabitans sp. SB3-54]WAX56416.1 barstar family protein [Jatrophihabitans sp. SB3-54]
MTGKRAAITAIYRQVRAPDWAAPNLDALADVLRDLSWLPAGPVRIAVPDLTGLNPDDRAALLVTLWRAVVESADAPHAITIEITVAGGFVTE